MSLVLHKPSGAVTLPDNDQWEHRFQIKSASSNSLYLVAHHKTKLFMYGGLNEKNQVLNSMETFDACICKF